MKETHSAGGVVANPKGKILIVNQKAHSWSLPKGHIEHGETPLETAKREIYEESGIKKLRYIKELGTYKRYRMNKSNKDDKSQMMKITMFLFKTNQKKLAPKDPDNPEARWVEKSKVAALLTHRKDKEFFLSIAKELK